MHCIYHLLPEDEMFRIAHDRKNLIWIFFALLLLTLPAFAGFSVQGTAVEFSSFRNKPNRMHVDLASNADMKDVTVQLLLLNSTGRPVLKREFAYQNFQSGKTNQYSAQIDGADLPGGKYGVAVGVYSANLASTFYYEDGLSQFNIIATESKVEPSVTMVNSKLTSSTDTLGENAVYSMELKSTTELNGLTVDILVEDKSRKLVSTQRFSEQTLAPLKTFEYTATFPKIALKPGKYSVSAGVSSESKLYLLKANAGWFTVATPHSIRTTGVGN
jgi:hypothetical protein